MTKRLYRGEENARRGNPIFSGLVIGLIIGLVLAIVVALWVRSNNPFKSLDKMPVQPPTANSTPSPTEPEPAPTYDFYKVLPEDTPTAPAAPVPPPPIHPKYYLQAGSFQNTEDADNLKAQLALLGIEAQIQTRDVPEKGVFHRVRIGPFMAMDAVNSTRALLVQNNIEADLVKEPSTPQEIE